MERLIFPDFIRVLSSISILYLCFRYLYLWRRSLLSKQDADSQNKRSEKKQVKDKKFQDVLFAVKIILILIVSIFIMFFYIDNLYYLLLNFGFYILTLIFFIIFGTKAMKLIVLSRGDLSRDKVAGSICLFGMILFLFGDIKWNNVWSLISEYTDYVVADILHAVLLVSLYFLYIIVIFSSTVFFFKDIVSFLIKKCKAKKSKTINTLNKISKKIIGYDPFTFKFRFHIKSNKKLNIMLNVIVDILLVIPGMAIFFFNFFYAILALIFHELLQVLKLVSEVKDDIIISRAFKVAIVLSLIIVVAINRYHPIFIYKEQSTSVLEFVASAILLPLIFEWIQSVSKRKSTKNDVLR